MFRFTIITDILSLSSYFPFVSRYSRVCVDRQVSTAYC